MGIVRFAFFASLILWCLPVRNLARKFAAWFFLPGVLCRRLLSALVAIGQSHPHFGESVRHLCRVVAGSTVSAICPRNRILSDAPQLRPVRSIALGRAARLRFVSLAIQRGLGFELPEVAATGRRIFVVLIASLIIKNLLDAAFAWPFRLMGSYISPLFTTPKEFPVWEWGNGLIECTVVAACTLLAFRSDRMESYPERFRRDAIGKVAA